MCIMVYFLFFFNVALESTVLQFQVVLHLQPDEIKNFQQLICCAIQTVQCTRVYGNKTELLMKLLTWR